MRGLRLMAVGLAAAVVLPGCAFLERKQEAQFLVSAASRVKAVSGATGTLSLTSVLKLPESVERQQREGGGLQLPGLQQSQQPVTVTFPVALDMEADSATLLPAAGAQTALATFEGSVVYLRRSGRGTERRPWAALDFDRVDARQSVSDANPVIGFLALNPTVLLDMAAGALSGSVEKIGSDTFAGVEVDGYEANFDWEKMLRAPDRESAGLKKLEEDESEALWRAYESMQVRDPLFPGEIWLDADGLPRRISMVIEQRFQIEGQGASGRRTRFETKATLELTDVSSPVSISIPDREETIRVDTFGQLMREATRGAPEAPGAPEGVSIIPGVPTEGARPQQQQGGTD